jgi:hypothetical protein
MEIGLISTSIGIILLILISYYLISWMFFSDHAITLHDSIKNARELYTVSADEVGSVKQGENYSYSFWLYVDEYNHNLGNKRNIITRSQGNPEIYLAPSTNDIVVEIEQSDINSGIGSNTKSCVLRNIDLQRWVHVCVVVSTRYIDLYYNGKLARSCVLSSPVAAQSNTDILLNNDGGFGGKMAKVNYYSRALSSSDVYRIYRRGPASIFMLNMLFGIDEINVKYRNAKGNSDSINISF